MLAKKMDSYSSKSTAIPCTKCGGNHPLSEPLKGGAPEWATQGGGGPREPAT